MRSTVVLMSLLPWTSQAVCAFGPGRHGSTTEQAALQDGCQSSHARGAAHSGQSHHHHLQLPRGPQECPHLVGLARWVATPPLQNVSVMCFRIWGHRERERERKRVCGWRMFSGFLLQGYGDLCGESFFSPVFLGLSASVCDVVVMCFEDFVRGSTSLDFPASRVSKGVLG